MSNPSKSMVYALLAAIGLLVLALTVLVWVDSYRVRRYTNEIQDLHYRLDSQEVELQRLRRQLVKPVPKQDSVAKKQPTEAGGDGWDAPASQ